MAIFQPVNGIITRIDDYWTGNASLLGCTKRMTLESQDGNIVNFVVTPATYFVHHVMVAEGETVTGFYDASAPALMIYPPQYQAVVMAREYRHENVKVDYFNEELVSRDGALKLNIAPSTRIVLENGQRFTGELPNRYLIVVYGATTRSIPAQTTPYEIIVMC